MKISVIGTGLVGASLAGALRQLPNVTEVVGYDQVFDHSVCAWERELVDSVADSPVAAAHQADLVVLAVPIPELEAAARDIVPVMQRGAILTDVGSVKRPVMEMLERIATPEISVIGGHPMAGSHRTGPLYASPRLFLDAPYFLCPAEGVDVTAYRRMVDLVTSIGARPTSVDAAQHDKIVAMVSHLPQLVSTSVMNSVLQASSNGSGEVLALAGTGFQDVTRLAASSPELWTGICSYNQQAISEALQIYRQCIEELASAVSVGDVHSLYEKLRTASDARRAMGTYCASSDMDEVDEGTVSSGELCSLSTP
jgi:prephenate dehydrogenase